MNLLLNIEKKKEEEKKLKEIQLEKKQSTKENNKKLEQKNAYLDYYGNDEDIVEKQPLEEADKLETINEIYDNNKRKINTNDNKTKVKSKKQKKLCY